MKFFPKDKTALNGRVFRSGLYSAAITAAVLVLAVLVNLLVRALPTKYTTFDLSEAGLYTLSDSSAQVAQGLTQDVTIYYLCETGNEDQIISKLLDKYASESSPVRRTGCCVWKSDSCLWGAECRAGRLRPLRL